MRQEGTIFRLKLHGQGFVTLQFDIEITIYFKYIPEDDN